MAARVDIGEQQARPGPLRRWEAQRAPLRDAQRHRERPHEGRREALVLGAARDVIVAQVNHERLPQQGRPNLEVDKLNVHCEEQDVPRGRLNPQMGEAVQNFGGVALERIDVHSHGVAPVLAPLEGGAGAKRERDQEHIRLFWRGRSRAAAQCPPDEEIALVLAAAPTEEKGQACKVRAGQVMHAKNK